MDRRVYEYFGILLVSLYTGGISVHAQQIWTNAMVHPWATSLKCSGSSLVATNANQPAGCIYASGSSDGAQIMFATCNNQNVQWFNIAKDSSGLFKFTNVNNGKCMDGWGQSTGGQLKQYNCQSGTQANQKYTLEYTRAVTSCPSDWSSYRIKIGSQCVTVSDSQLIWQACAGDKMTASQNFFIQNGGSNPPTGGGCTKYYTVKSGDTCYIIWTTYSLDSNTFYALNPGINCNNLQIGQQVCIGGGGGPTPSPRPPPPSTPTPTSTPPAGCTKYYTVKSGDTCYIIWTTYGLSSATFYVLNPGIKCNNLQIGQQVCIAGGSGPTPPPTPPPTPTPPGGRPYPEIIAYWGTMGGDPTLRVACDQGYTIIQLAFLANWGNYQDISQPQIYSDSWGNIGRDIPYCQSKNIRVILSMAGANGNYGFSSVGDAQWTADQMWNLYMGGTSNKRPFGSAKIDGVDFDLEKGNGQYVVDFIDRLNGYYRSSGRDYWFTAAPQCIYPDEFMKSFLNTRGSLFKYIFVQFYNNKPCDGNQANIINSFSKDWSPFVKGFSPQPKLVIGLPASYDAAPYHGYIGPSEAASTIRAAKAYGTLAGFGFWAVNYDLVNRFNGYTWSQTVVRYGVN